MRLSNTFWRLKKNPFILFKSGTFTESDKQSRCTASALCVCLYPGWWIKMYLTCYSLGFIKPRFCFWGLQSPIVEPPPKRIECEGKLVNWWRLAQEYLILFCGFWLLSPSHFLLLCGPAAYASSSLSPWWFVLPLIRRYFRISVNREVDSDRQLNAYFLLFLMMWICS